MLVPWETATCFGHELRLWSPVSRVCIQASLLPSCVTLGELLNFSVPHFPQSKYRAITAQSCSEDSMHSQVQCSELCLPDRKPCIKRADYFYFVLKDDRKIKTSSSLWETLHHGLLFLEMRRLRVAPLVSVFRI